MPPDQIDISSNPKQVFIIPYIIYVLPQMNK